ncbi:hypothetical protein [Tahibacter amnicola]|uniref:Uncharacterized protein n=1 Tax=Tahibacter amnicola TaxID=2976241 RepID=A0ABY6B732_9GAMM|nr:hypothetical protein [Tahibacter amnicola]UXI65913.1 hypothetical protein N4264_14225 [Tahibacter amnicola]
MHNVLGFGFLAFAFASTASAQNLVSNGDFTSDITTSWTAENAGGTGVTGSGVYDDDSGSATVGSARLNLAESGPGSTGVVQGLNQCIAAPGSPPWDFGGRIRFTLDNPGAGGPNLAFIAVQFYAGANCTGSQTSQLLFTGSGTSVNGFVDGVAVANWERVSQTGFADPMPGGSATASVRIAARVQTDGTGDSLSALFDGMFFGPAGTTPVSLQSFSVE